jgi:hypothetical protein
MTAKVQRCVKTEARTCGGVRTCCGGKERDTAAKEKACERGREVVNSGTFIKKLLHNHSVNIK